MSNSIIVRIDSEYNARSPDDEEIMMQCLTSHMMTKLILWRNPKGKEANWIFQRMPSSRRPILLKLLCTQIAFASLTIVALVETIAYSILTFFTLPFNYITVKRPLQFSLKLLQSSSFSVLWSLSNLFFNFASPNLLTKEKFARDFIFHGGVSPNDIRV